MNKKFNFNNCTKDSKAMEKAFQLSIDEITGVLEGKRTNTEITRLAANTLSNYSRIKSTETHDKALELMIVSKDLKVIE